MDEKTLFAERLKEALIAAGYEPRPSVLEREFNLRYWGSPMTFQGVRRWLRGESIPAQNKLQVLAGWLGVEPHYLRYGARAACSPELSQATWMIAVGGEEDEVLRVYRGLPDEQRQLLRQVILTFARANELEPDRAKPPSQA
ncbi:transcriptional regulator [Salinicola endophyticus]|uniref:Transcriptional regulator n=1 Tax=Salinicola endophyticus TaxID=1949083 RepID=A0ABY8FH00_9GAMM|nr:MULTISPECIES: transcriptional regulator [Salinicola]WFF42094.1 transcriptional regulator [Salinicola endophyticus]